MSSKGDFTASPPPRLGVDRFYSPPALRRQRQTVLHQQEMIQRQLLLQQHQQLQQQLLLERSEVVAQESSSKAEAVKRSDFSDSSSAAALSVPLSVVPALTGNATNLDRLLESVTPVVQARYLSEVDASDSGTRQVDSHPFFNLEDLWDSFDEWSAYGARVPFLINGIDPIEQYYVPFLSGIQLYTDQTKHSSCLGRRNEENHAKSHGLASGTGSSNSEGDEKPNSNLNMSVQQLNKLSLGDKSVVSSPSFQFLEYEQPYNRRPLADKVSVLASECPELTKSRSCDLLPTSWICVAWYPIYRIPVGPTLQDLDASFLTFHSLSTQSRRNCSPQFHAANVRILIDSEDASAKISLPVFALASYKLKGSIASPSELHECEQENSLLQEADSWLRHLEVILPDYQFFRAHYTPRR